MTVSIRNFVEYGNTRPDTRLMTIKRKPMASKPRRGRTSSKMMGKTLRSSVFGRGVLASLVGEATFLIRVQFTRRGFILSASDKAAAVAWWQGFPFAPSDR